MSDLIKMEVLNGETEEKQILKARWRKFLMEADQESLVRLLRFAAADHVVFSDSDLNGLFNRTFQGVPVLISKKVGHIGKIIENLDIM